MTIMVFTGAGASRAIGPKFPTTAEFYDALDKEIKDKIINVHFGGFNDYIAGKKYNVVDIEHILWAIEEFRENCRRGHDAKDSLFHIIGPKYSDLSNDMDLLNRELAELEEDIHAKIYDIYGHIEFSEEEESVIRKLANFIGSLWDISNPVELFTTNYDMVLDTILQNVIPNKIYNCKKQSYSRIVLDYPLPRELIKGNGRLTKLHGSIDWHIRGEYIVITGSDHYTGDRDKHLLIGLGAKDIFYRKGGSKKKYARRYFVTAHDHLAAVARAASAAVFIGFSFRDEEINKRLEEMDPAIPKYIINKGEIEAIPRFLMKDNGCSYYYDKGLDDESIKHCTDYISDSIDRS